MTNIKMFTLAASLLVGSTVLALAQSSYTSGAADNAHSAASSYNMHGSGRGAGGVERGARQ